MTISPLLPAHRALALAALLVWLAPRVGRAEDSLSYKYSDYREANGRVAVKTQGAYLQKSLGTAMHLKFEGVLDAITGATPSGQPAPVGSDQVPLSKLTEHRKAWNADLSRQFSGINVALGIGNSRESDYVSTGWSLNTLTDFNQKNTMLLAGVAGTDDDIKVFFQTPRVKKRTNDVIVGVTQLLDPRTSVTANLTWGRATGFMADPYKLVQKNTEVFPGVFLPLTFAENRPSERNKGILFLGLNRSFPEVRGALDASYRYYRDTYDTDAHTLDLTWFQRVGEKIVLRPWLRYYQQTAAEFYRYKFDGTSIVPQAGPPRSAGPFYSSDFRLSALRTITYGFKVVWNVTDAVAVDAALEQYDMHGRDGITPKSAYVQARIVTAGVKYAW
jgi:hypothetical protein